MTTRSCDRCGVIADAWQFIAISVNGEVYPLCLGCVGELGVWWSSVDKKEVKGNGEEATEVPAEEQQADQAEEGEAVRVLSEDREAAEEGVEREARDEGEEEG